MKKRRLVLSDAAIADIVEQADWYDAQSGERLARRWERAVTFAVSLVANRPRLGATCAFRSSEVKDLRRMSISDFPRHLLFYRFDEEEVFILRIIHGARDLEGLFS